MCLQRVGLGCSEVFQCFKLRHRGRVPLSRMLLRNGCPRHERHARDDAALSWPAATVTTANLRRAGGLHCADPP
jgi:hypothetical protein